MSLAVGPEFGPRPYATYAPRPPDPRFHPAAAAYRVPNGMFPPPPPPAAHPYATSAAPSSQDPSLAAGRGLYSASVCPPPRGAHAPAGGGARQQYYHGAGHAAPPAAVNAWPVSHPRAWPPPASSAPLAGFPPPRYPHEQQPGRGEASQWERYEASYQQQQQQQHHGGRREEARFAQYWGGEAYYAESRGYEAESRRGESRPGGGKKRKDEKRKESRAEKKRREATAAVTAAAAAASSRGGLIEVLATAATEVAKKRGRSSEAEEEKEQQQQQQRERKAEAEQRQEHKGRPKRIAIGTRLEVHTYPWNDTSLEPRWFGAEVTGMTIVPNLDQREGFFKVECEIAYDEDPVKEVDTIVWPDDAKDVRFCSSEASGVRPKPSEAEVSHMLQFFVCQVRAEYAEIVAASSEEASERCGASRRAAYDEFDAELRRYCAARDLEWRDVASCEPFMRLFLLGRCARGDKWMPWHTALGAHERYILGVVRRLVASERDRHALTYAFSGSREIDLFEHVFRPLYDDDASPDDARLGRLVLDDPAAAFARDGELHRRLLEYRRRGKRLHTTAYSCHPPRGSSGDEFVFYILDRTRRFVEIGHAAFDILADALDAPLRTDGPDLRARLERKLMSCREIGPTMTKMFLAHPRLGLLDDACAVGDGADAAFDFLYPDLAPRARPKHRALLLDHLHDHIHQHCADDRLLLPRFHHMLNWVAARARRRFADSVLPDALGDTLLKYDLQVNLCEWRKFRTAVDPSRFLACGALLPADAVADDRRRLKKHPPNARKPSPSETTHSSGDDDAFADLPARLDAPPPENPADPHLTPSDISGSPPDSQPSFLI